MLSRSLLGFMVAAIAFAPVEGSGGSSVFIQTAGDAVDLGNYRWRNRPLLLFAPSATEPAYVCSTRRLGCRSQRPH